MFKDLTAYELESAVVKHHKCMMAREEAIAASTITTIEQANSPFRNGLAKFVLFNVSVRVEYNTWFCKAIRLLDHTSLMDGFCGSNKEQISAYRLELFDTIPRKLKKSFADIISTYGRTKTEHWIYGGPGFDTYDAVNGMDIAIAVGDNSINKSGHSDTDIVSDAPAGSDVSVTSVLAKRNNPAT